MMLPSAAPMTLAVTRIHAARTPGRGAMHLVWWPGSGCSCWSRNQRRWAGGLAARAGGSALIAAGIALAAGVVG